MVIFISIFNREKNLLCIFYQLFEHVEILYSKNFSGYFTQPTAFTINTHLYFDKINVLQVCILTVESYSMGYLEMIVRRSGIIVVIICQTINGAEIISISPFITIIYNIKYEYTEIDGCGSLDFLFRGLKFHVWEYEDRVWGAETNIYEAGRSQDIEGNYEEVIAKEILSWPDMMPGS